MPKSGANMQTERKSANGTLFTCVSIPALPAVCLLVIFVLVSVSTECCLSNSMHVGMAVHVKICCCTHRFESTSLPAAAVPWGRCIIWQQVTETDRWQHQSGAPLVSTPCVHSFTHYPLHAFQSADQVHCSKHSMAALHLLCAAKWPIILWLLTSPQRCLATAKRTDTVTILRLRADLGS